VCRTCTNTTATPTSTSPIQLLPPHHTTTHSQHGLLPSAPLSLPGKNAINLALLAGNIVAAGVFLTTADPDAGLAALTATALMAGVAGAHLTASIGGADMPVVITLLNSYSGGCMWVAGDGAPVSKND
jgi:NAD/NADP transhydrogenase beta subunit